MSMARVCGHGHGSDWTACSECRMDDLRETIATKDAVIERLKKSALKKTQKLWSDIMPLIERRMREDESLYQCAKRLLKNDITKAAACGAVRDKCGNKMDVGGVEMCCPECANAIAAIEAVEVKHE